MGASEGAGEETGALEEYESVSTKGSLHSLGTLVVDTVAIVSSSETKMLIEGGPLRKALRRSIRRLSTEPSSSSLPPFECSSRVNHS